MTTSLTINGIDFNKELDLLSDYLKEIINNQYPTYIIDINALSNLDVKKFIKLFKQTGLIFTNSETITVNEITPITFQKYKENIIKTKNISYDKNIS